MVESAARSNPLGYGVVIVAFWPAGEAWEEGIYTGGAAVNGRGQPTAQVGNRDDRV